LRWADRAVFWAPVEGRGESVVSGRHHLLGKFKGESGAHRHQVALASTTQSGIEEGGGWSGFWRCTSRFFLFFLTVLIPLYLVRVDQIYFSLFHFFTFHFCVRHERGGRICLFLTLNEVVRIYLGTIDSCIMIRFIHSVIVADEEIGCGACQSTSRNTGVRIAHDSRW